MADQDNIDSFILESLNTQMRCGILSNAHGDVVILYDKEIKSDVQWIEYNTSEFSFSLVYEDGSLQDLGLKFDNKMQNNIQQAKEVTLIHIIDGKKHKEQKINLIIQTY